MPKNDRSLARGMIADAARDARRRPLMWLILSASAAPQVFLLNFLAPGAPERWYILLLLAGYSICFCVQFLFWCMAVFLFHGDAGHGKAPSYPDAFSRMRACARPALWPGLISGAVAVLAFITAQMLVSIALSFFLSGGVNPGSLFALTLVHFYLSYLVADLALVLIVLVPQMICLEGGRKVEEVFRASYTLARERYRDAFVLFIVPELVVRTLFLGASFAIYYVPGLGLIFAFLVVSMSLLEGGRTAFVAAAFNRFYYHVLEEERKKKGKGARKGDGREAGAGKAADGRGAKGAQKAGKAAGKRPGARRK